ncbi:c-type cytochrome biogenesis protein CcsB [Candidatus Formimonas warabiya]|uniref:c-type cytochrome biogenesis protein CcsB n=1 Tax=Formimonas warabiya TaxID=1761012 RepID=UPI001EFF7F63|nr:c-type cytochrome biogenesis protein CcsB [Candidatus Formimonas warabiya]
MESIFNSVAYLFLILATFFSLLSLWKPNRFLEKASFGGVLTAFIFLTLFLGWRSWTLDRLPVTSLYEFVFLFSWGILVLYLFTWRKLKLNLYTFLTAFFNVLIFSVGNTFSAEARPLVPALQSVWLQFHVLTAILAYGGFGIACFLGIIYLIKGSKGGTEAAVSLGKRIDHLIYWSVAVGFSFLTLVIITGAVWAEQVWGSWWNWDPKETWALITWLIYAGYLHVRKTYGWQGKKGAILVIVGFVAVLFTLFGVTLLLHGVHSYG